MEGREMGKAMKTKHLLEDRETIYFKWMPFFGNVTLVKGDDTISDEGQAYWVNFLLILDILCDTNGVDDPLLKAIEKYKKHSITEVIKNIKAKIIIFCFQRVSYEDVLKEIQKLDASSLSGYWCPHKSY